MNDLWRCTFSPCGVLDNSGGTAGDADGAMDWATAKSWAENLNYYGITGWRLPTALNKDGSGQCGPAVGCTGSEMGHHFYNNFEAAAAQSVLTGTNTTNLALFSNIVSASYWSGTSYAPDTSAWYFDMSYGWQNYYTKTTTYYAWAVHDGDVAAIPEPETYAMMLAGLALLGWAASRRRM